MRPLLKTTAIPDPHNPKEGGYGGNLGFPLFVYRLLPEGGNLGFPLFVYRPEGTPSVNVTSF
ncbi:MAG: hypothetical protein QOK44_1554, partial [Betaproteobacteria bacterium]|nr:hypothetical protein [Betaproteobacteria bacterium]